MSEATVDAFLAHHGVKGQHWGIRNKIKSELTPARKKRIKDISIGAGSALALTGATAAAVYLHHKGALKRKGIPLNQLGKGLDWTIKAPKNIWTMPISELIKR